ncbi:TIGR02302 family protein [Caenispirillum salinarum]|uniref:TIGR02302 family protein n=1 Tax=Caenispirillum salinarum TaxID=859058 RepID=UPI00384F402A
MPGRILLTRASLLAERLWERLWPALTLAAVFFGLAFLDILPRLPGWLHLGLLVALAVGTLAALVLGLRRFPWPSRGEARTALETRGAPGDHRLPYHRPLTALEDQPSRPHGDSLAAGLWEAHRARMLAAAKRLSVPFPSPRMASRDPAGVRAVGVLLLVVGAAIGWGDLGQRLERALNPTLPAPTSVPLTADIWITPPAYTGRAPLTLAAGTGPDAEGAGGVAAPQAAGPLRVPEGSAVVALVHGADDPALRVDGTGGATIPFEAIGDGSHRLETQLSAGQRLAILEDGDVVESWPMTVVPDMPPTVRFTGPPEETSRWRLRLPYAAGDDYAIETFLVQITRPDRPDAETLEVELTAPAPGPADAELVEQPGRAAIDLTPHPWAGLSVTVRLKATDAAGQTAYSDPIDTILPERQFQHPIARAIAAVRKEVARDPDQARDAAKVLDQISREPARFSHDSVVFLGLRIAADRLYHSGDDTAERDGVLDLLWDLAIRLEDGGLTLAGRDLERAEEALREALENDAPDAEVERLMQELQQALQRFSEMMAEMMRDMPQMPPFEGPMPDNMQTLDPQGMQEMLDRMREMNELGARDAAKAMLDELSRMMEAMRNMRPMSPEQMQQMQQAQEMMRELQDLAREQERLLEETFRRSQQFPQSPLSPFQQPPMPGQQQQGQQQQGQQQQGQQQQDQQGEQETLTAAEQEALRKRLGDLMRRLGEMTGQVPENLGDAELAMRRAEEALRGQQPGPASQAQGEALEALRDGMGQSMQQMMQAMGMGQGMMMPMPMPMGRGQMPGRDPLGRQQGMDPDTVEVPTEPEEKRARELLEELRRRASERDRPTEELDYLRRLLRQF